MVSKEVVISNQVGLHARPATFFIQKANEYKCSIWVEKDERRVNAKSLLGVLHHHHCGRLGRGRGRDGTHRADRLGLRGVICGSKQTDKGVL